MVSGVSAFSEAAPLKEFEFNRTAGVFGRYCSSCHDWAGSYESILESGVIIPGDSYASPALIAINEGWMPPAKPLPTPEEKRYLTEWVDAGAPKPSEAAAGVATGASIAQGALPGTSFMGFKSKEQFHRVSGWTSAGLLLAAGVVGSIHALDMQSAAHAYRDDQNITEVTMGGLCVAKIQDVWGADLERTLRWTHVGLLVAGESLYLANAITGIGFIGPDRPGLSKSKLHRWAFFIHGGLMMAEATMGFFTTEALRAGNHELVSTLGVAHAVVGLTIPVVIIASGSVMSRR